jgi:RNA polymerase sigma-70 factor (ECF subfamily)
VTSALEPVSSADSRRDAAFQSTLWTQVRAAGQLNAPSSRQALETLCRLYWPPIYSFLRRCGHERHAAMDLTQGFFAYLLEQELLKKADPDKGRFRSFLLGSLKFFVSNQRAKDRALKRGGGAEIIPLDSDLLNDAEPATQSTPERLFERKWALAVLAEAMRRLGEEYRRGGMADQFALLQPYLTGDAAERLPVLADRLGKSEGATRVLVCRLRNRFRRLIRGVIADTVSDAAEVENELRHLEAALRDN